MDRGKLDEQESGRTMQIRGPDNGTVMPHVESAE